MRKQGRFLVAWGAVVAVISLASISEGAPPPHPLAPKGYVLVEEDVWLRLADEPGRHMQLARDLFVKRDLKRSAQEIRKAEFYLRGSASHSHADARVALLNCAHDFDHLARRVETGHVRSLAELDASFARAQHSLANYHYLKATDSWAERQAVRTGLYLHAATDHLEDAAQFTGDAATAGVREVVRDTRAVAGKLVDGTHVVVEDVSHGFERFGNHVERTGRDVWQNAPLPVSPPAGTQP